MKTFADSIALLLVVVIAGLATISVAAVWKLIEVQNILYKSFFSFFILLGAYLIVIFATKYWELRHQDQTPPVNPTMQ